MFQIKSWINITQLSKIGSIEAKYWCWQWGFLLVYVKKKIILCFQIKKFNKIKF